jgi:phosphoribosyl 1,2-cyclic phosphodiesterase
VLTFSLQSGSNGNAIYVEADGVKLLFDAGISGSQAQARLGRHGRDIRDVDALVLSHGHADHVRCAGVYHRKFGLPVYMTAGTQRSCQASLGRVGPVRPFRAGETLTFGRARVHTLPTPHDAAEAVAFVIECHGKRLGLFTDLGNPFRGLSDALESCDAAYLESNFDPHMLANGSYPAWLKNRVAGPGGHLSNAQAADLLARCGRRRPRWVALAHLSEENNRPALALESARKAVGKSYPLYIASRYEVSDPREV